MVGFPHLTKEDRWAMVHFIRSLTKNKVKDNITQLKKFGATAK